MNLKTFTADSTVKWGSSQFHQCERFQSEFYFVSTDQSFRFIFFFATRRFDHPLLFFPFWKWTVYFRKVNVEWNKIYDWIIDHFKSYIRIYLWWLLHVLPYHFDIKVSKFKNIIFKKNKQELRNIYVYIDHSIDILDKCFVI